MKKKMNNPNTGAVERLTKKYIIDLLNTVFFSNTLTWDSLDQFNALPIFNSEEATEAKNEQRGTLLVHNKYRHALRVLITASETNIQSVCYRITSLHKPITLETQNKMCFPFALKNVDLSIADLNLGLQDVSSYSFCNNLQCDGSTSKEFLFSLLKFLMDSDIFIYEDRELFVDMLDAVKSSIPISSDQHYIPIFGQKEIE